MCERVLFLDFDGVINTPMLGADKDKFSYGNLECGVNNFQAVQWISELCDIYDFDIVVISVWRFNNDYVSALRKSGLRENINIIGALPAVSAGDTIGSSIEKYLQCHTEIKYYLIIDDEKDKFLPAQMEHLVKTDGLSGFGMRDFINASTICAKWFGNKFNRIL